MEFKRHDKNSAPVASKPVLEEAEKKYGFTPNLFGVMAESPAALKAYTTLSGILEEDAGLDAQEQQIVMLATSEFNGCDYCMAAHSTVAERMAKVPPEIIEALRDGGLPEDARAKALVRLTRALLEHRGWLPKNEQAAFLEAGYDQQALLEVITILALKTLSNYTNHLADTPLDEAFQDKAWSKDS